MSERRGERVGWIGGWLGGFVWVLILSIVFLTRGQIAAAVLGAALCVAAVATIVLLAPWRHPATKYRTLMLPIYALLVAAVAWSGWGLGDFHQMGINGWWSAPILLPIVLPLWIAGDRRWDDRDGENALRSHHER